MEETLRRKKRMTPPAIKRVTKAISRKSRAWDGPPPPFLSLLSAPPSLSKSLIAKWTLCSVVFCKIPTSYGFWIWSIWSIIYITTKHRQQQVIKELIDINELMNDKAATWAHWVKWRDSHWRRENDSSPFPSRHSISSRKGRSLFLFTVAGSSSIGRSLTSINPPNLLQFIVKPHVWIETSGKILKWEADSLK